MPLHQHLQNQMHYHHWAYQQLQRSLRSLPSALLMQDNGLYFGSIINTLNHLLATEEIFYTNVILNKRITMAVDSIITIDIRHLFTRLEAVTYHWQNVLQTPEKIDLTKICACHDIPYLDTDISLAEMLMQISLHAVHHRGQISASMTNLGYAPPVMDFSQFLIQKRADKKQCVTC
ncbi:MAG: DinB family protein [Plesiomonas sp.]|uniref:DinB family protein n=2 Tax=Plesiomonas sp. TaxID=2486279 RepID=UPI003F3C5D22